MFPGQIRESGTKSDYLVWKGPWEKEGEWLFGVDRAETRGEKSVN